MKLREFNFNSLKHPFALTTLCVSETEINRMKGCLLEKPCVCFLWNLLIERLMKVGGSLILSSSSSNELGDKGDKGECFCKDFFQIGVF